MRVATLVIALGLVGAGILLSSLIPKSTDETGTRIVDENFATAIQGEYVAETGQPRDGVPAIDHPKFISITVASEWMPDASPGIVVRVGAETRFYPEMILAWHEVVNDSVARIPIMVTYSPLTGSSAAFRRDVLRTAPEFGTAGLVYDSNTILYDRTSESLWTQFDGLAIRGTHLGTRLPEIPTLRTTFKVWKEQFPDGTVLSRETGYQRAYAENPFAQYSTSPTTLYPTRESGLRHPLKTSVLGVVGTDAPWMITTEALRERGIVSVSDADTPFVILADGYGNGNAFAAELHGRLLTFTLDDGVLHDQETGSTWSRLGVATAGPLSGEHLDPIPARSTYWFAWAGWYPDATVIDPDSLDGSSGTAILE